MPITFNVAIRRSLTRSFCVTTLLLYSLGVNAHEFWIEPQSSQVDVGQQMTATLNVGQDLKGSSYSYLPQRFERFTVTIKGDTQPVKSRLGDNPALNMNADQEGLHVFAYQSNAESLTYTNPSKFKGFLDYEGLDWVLKRHSERGLPPANFKETYTRFAKALVQVGPYNEDSSNADVEIGLPIELVALQSPFSANANSIQTRLLRNGKPLKGIQVATFQRTKDGAVSRKLTRSDADGVARIDITGGGFFLISAVQMEEVDPDALKESSVGRKPVWQSLWASLSFNLGAE